MKSKFWQDWIILFCAVWLFFSPFILDFANLAFPAPWVAWILAVLLALSASEAVRFADEIGEWLDLGIGAALMLAPLTFGFEFFALPAANFEVVGLVVVACAISAAMRDRRLLDEKYATAR